MAIINLSLILERVDPKVINKKTMESLIKTGVFDNLEERNKLLSNLERILNWSRENQKQKKMDKSDYLICLKMEFLIN